MVHLKDSLAMVLIMIIKADQSELRECPIQKIKSFLRVNLMGIASIMLHIFKKKYKN